MEVRRQVAVVRPDAPEGTRVPRQSTLTLDAFERSADDPRFLSPPGATS